MANLLQRVAEIFSPHSSHEEQPSSKDDDMGRPEGTGPDLETENPPEDTRKDADEEDAQNSQVPFAEPSGGRSRSTRSKSKQGIKGQEESPYMTSFYVRAKRQRSPETGRRTRSRMTPPPASDQLGHEENTLQSSQESNLSLMSSTPESSMELIDPSAISGVPMHLSAFSLSMTLKTDNKDDKGTTFTIGTRSRRRPRGSKPEEGTFSIPDREPSQQREEGSGSAGTSQPMTRSRARSSAERTPRDGPQVPEDKGKETDRDTQVFRPDENLTSDEGGNYGLFEDEGGRASPPPPSDKSVELEESRIEEIPEPAKKATGRTSPRLSTAESPEASDKHGPAKVADKRASPRLTASAPEGHSTRPQGREKEKLAEARATDVSSTTTPSEPHRRSTRSQTPTGTSSSDQGQPEATASSSSKGRQTEIGFSGGRGGKRIGFRKKPKRKSERAGTVLPVGRFHRLIREQNSKKMRVSAGAAVYAAASIEYLVAEILEIAGMVAKEDGRKRISPQHIHMTVKGDTEIEQLFHRVIIPESGVPPFIHPELLPRNAPGKGKAKSGQGRKAQAQTV